MANQPISKLPPNTPLMEVMRDISEFLIQRRVGNVQINMFKGGITNWNINETKKAEVNNST